MSAPPEVAPGVHLVDTGYLRPGLAASYVVRGGAGAAVVETGHGRAAPRILAGLAALGVPPEGVSHVVVTHVHLDHAGGAGALLRALPAARLVVHPRGARHLVDPSRLFAGTAAVYGEGPTRALHGDPVPVEAARVIEAGEGFALDLGGRPLRFLDAPGHARHHLAVWDEATRGLFTGDTFGISYRETDGPRGPFLFPTTTPVQFDPGPLHATVDRLLALRPARAYLTHFGPLEGDLAALGAGLHRLVDAHVAVARAAPAGPGRAAALREGVARLLLDALEAQGSAMGREAAAAFLADDVELNAQGLAAWLEAGGG